MLKRFLLLLLCTAFVLPICGAEDNKTVFMREKQNVLKSGKPFISASFDSCEIWYPAAKNSNITFEYRKDNKKDKWLKSKAEYFECNGISGYKTKITNLPEPQRYAAYAIKATQDGKVPPNQEAHM